MIVTADCSSIDHRLTLPVKSVPGSFAAPGNQKYDRIYG